MSDNPLLQLAEPARARPLLELGRQIISGKKAMLNIRNGLICGRVPTFGDAEQAQVCRAVADGHEAQLRIKEMVDRGDLGDDPVSVRFEEVRVTYASCPVCHCQTEYEGEYDGERYAFEQLTEEIPGITDTRSCSRCFFPLTR